MFVNWKLRLNATISLVQHLVSIESKFEIKRFCMPKCYFGE